MTVRVESNSYLTEEQHQVYQLRDSLERNGGTPIGFLELLAAVTAEETWKKVPSGVNREEPFNNFSEFIEASPLRAGGQRGKRPHTASVAASSRRRATHPRADGRHARGGHPAPRARPRT